MFFWYCFNVTIILFAETYAEAVSKAKLAETTSDLETPIRKTANKRLVTKPILLSPSPPPKRRNSKYPSQLLTTPTKESDIFYETPDFPSTSSSAVQSSSSQFQLLQNILKQNEQLQINFESFQKEFHQFKETVQNEHVEIKKLLGKLAEKANVDESALLLNLDLPKDTLTGIEELEEILEKNPLDGKTALVSLSQF